jgi:hypothetical protein
VVTVILSLLHTQQDIGKIVETLLNVRSLSLGLNVFTAVINFIWFIVSVSISPCFKGHIFVSSHKWLTNIECFVLLLDMVCPPLKLAFKIWECIIFYTVPHWTKWQTPINSMLPTSDIQRAQVRALTFVNVIVIHTENLQRDNTVSWHFL